MKPHTALAAFLCLAACSLPAQSRTAGQNNRGNGLMTAPASTNRSSAGQSGGRGIFDIATRPDPNGKNNKAAPAAGRTTTTASPFGTTSPRTKASSSRRWKTTCKIADCIRANAIPGNTNVSISGTITNIVTDGRYTILTMFDSVSITTESGTTADIPVTFTVVLDAELAGNTSYKTNAKKSFTVDGNYVYFVWNDSGCTIRAVENSLTEQYDQTMSSITRRDSK